MTGAVVTLGEALIRLSVSDGRTLANARSLELLVGGAEANVAVALARLGKRATWISRVSRDPLGQRVVAELRSHGVNCEHVTWAEHSRTGVYYTEIAPAPRGI